MAKSRHYPTVSTFLLMQNLVESLMMGSAVTGLNQHGCVGRLFIILANTAVQRCCCVNKISGIPIGCNYVRLTLHKVMHSCDYNCNNMKNLAGCVAVLGGYVERSGDLK